MKAVEWKKEKDGVFECKLGEIRITVLNTHLHYKGLWVLHCYKLQLDTFPLGSIDEESAKRDALDICGKRLRAIFGDIMEAVEFKYP